MGHADILRRAMGKKDMKVMEEERRNFIYGEKDEEGKILTDGAIRNGVDEAVASKIYDLMLDFANYAFNKSHSAAYAVVAYRTAWLKHYYPVEFMAALISSVMNDTASVSLYIQESKRLGIEVLPPDINESKLKFTVSGRAIRFGLSAVKNVGTKFIDAIIKARGDGEFKSLTDFLERVAKEDAHVLNKRAVESLIKCGAMDSLGGNRAQYLSIYERTLDSISADNKRNIKGQVSLFEALDIDFNSDDLPDLKDFPKNIRLNMEKEMVGIYLSGHPLEEYEDRIKKIVDINSLELINYSEDEMEQGMTQVRDGLRVTMAGLINSRKNMLTKNNKMMAFIGLEDLYGEVECIVFPNVYERYMTYLVEDSIVIVRGRISISDRDSPQLIVDSIRELKKPSSEKLYIRIDSSSNQEALRMVKENLVKYPGNTPVYIYFSREDLLLAAEEDLWISKDQELIDRLSLSLGKESIKFQ